MLNIKLDIRSGNGINVVSFTEDETVEILKQHYIKENGIEAAQAKLLEAKT